MNLNLKKSLFTVLVFIVIMFSISCNIELPPLGRNLKVLSHNIPRGALDFKAEPIVIKFSEPLMSEYSKIFLTLRYMPCIVKDKFAYSTAMMILNATNMAIYANPNGLEVIAKKSLGGIAKTGKFTDGILFEDDQKLGIGYRKK